MPAGFTLCIVSQVVLRRLVATVRTGSTSHTKSFPPICRNSFKVAAFNLQYVTHTQCSTWKIYSLAQIIQKWKHVCIIFELDTTITFIGAKPETGHAYRNIWSIFEVLPKGGSKYTVFPMSKLMLKSCLAHTVPLNPTAHSFMSVNIQPTCIAHRDLWGLSIWWISLFLLEEKKELLKAIITPTPCWMHNTWREISLSLKTPSARREQQTHV